MAEKKLYAMWIKIFMTVMLVVGFGCGESRTSHAFDTSLLIAPKKAEQAARTGLQYYLSTISEWELPYFNFHSRDEFKDAKIGTPFRVFHFTNARSILQGAPNKPLIDLVEPTPEWVFPVISRGEYRTILFVDFEKGTWKASGIGDSDRAKSFAHIMNDWPASKGYKYVFVRHRATYSEFIILIHPQKISVIPLPNAIIVWGLKEEKVLDQSDALSLFKKSLNEFNNSHKKGPFN